MLGFLFLGSSILLLGLEPTSYELIVKTTKDSNVIDSQKGEAVAIDEANGYELLSFDSEEKYLAAKEVIEASGNFVEPNVRIYADDLSADEINYQEASSLWHLANSQKGIHALAAWGSHLGRGRIYVVDSGIDHRNSDFGPRVVASFSAIDGQDALDRHGHGSHIASVAAGALDAAGSAGVAPGDVEIVNVRMLDEDSGGSSFLAIRAYQFIREDIESYLSQDPKHFAVILNAWGGAEYSGALEDAMRSVSGPRVLLVTSAGNNSLNNDERSYYPCNFQIEGKICVAASSPSSSLAAFSNYGANHVHLSAPGVNIFGANTGIVRGDQYSPRWGLRSGTSQATAVTGGAALVLWAAEPSISSEELIQLFMLGADPDPLLKTKTLSGGKLNLMRSIELAQSGALKDSNSIRAASSRKVSGCGMIKDGDSTQHPLHLLILVSLSLGSLLFFRKFKAGNL